MSAPETRQLCQAGPARTGRVGLGANSSKWVPELLGGHRLQAILSCFSSLRIMLPACRRASPGLWAFSGIRQGVPGRGLKRQQGLKAMVHFPPLFLGFTAKFRAGGGTIWLGSISWCSHTPQELGQAFCKGPDIPRGRCPTASWGQRGHIARQHEAAVLCCPHFSHVGPWRNMLQG